ncbi:hypothetical protein CK203_047351 [Vitis vinifera]|uniref:Reverse transcriptase domain-containing protein n=1 Tax=Vitis vinifera TaxID=29760 RepID=A0A438HHL9_VITVI|nr:hypothetical protein CK203_047351 [Vitis vinifera]
MEAYFEFQIYSLTCNEGLVSSPSFDRGDRQGLGVHYFCCSGQRRRGQEKAEQWVSRLGWFLNLTWGQVVEGGRRELDQQLEVVFVLGKLVERRREEKGGRLKFFQWGHVVRVVRLWGTAVPIADKVLEVAASLFYSGSLRQIVKSFQRRRLSGWELSGNEDSVRVLSSFADRQGFESGVRGKGLRHLETKSLLVQTQLPESFNPIKTKSNLPSEVFNLVTVSQGDVVVSPSGEFQIEGLSHKKMAEVHEVLSSLDIKVYSRRKSRRSTVMIQEAQKVECDRRFVGSVWTFRNKEWAALPMCGASILIANETVDEKRRSSEEGVVFKIDFGKGYDHVLVNGNAKEWVKASKGLRQGDPLSPFLFTLVVDVLNDTIFFSNTSEEELQILKSLLLVFGHISGLKVNLDKSNIYGINLEQNHLSRLAKLLDCKASGVGEGKRDYLVSWDVVCKLKAKRGLGFGKIVLRNVALLGKWLWRYPRKGSALWHQVILSIYGSHSNGWDANTIVKWLHRCPWKAIAQVFQEFSKFTRFVVGDEERIRFWEDLWWGDQPLESQYPRLFRQSIGFEIEDLEGLMRSLDCLHLSSSVSDARSWYLSSSGLFTVKSFFLPYPNVLVLLQFSLLSSFGILKSLSKSSPLSGWWHTRRPQNIVLFIDDERIVDPHESGLLCMGSKMGVNHQRYALASTVTRPINLPTWRPRWEKRSVRETQIGPVSKKSSPTGSTSKQWRFRDLLWRSNSDDKDSFVFLTPPQKATRFRTSSTRPKNKISQSKNEITLAGKRDCDANGTSRRSKEAATLLHVPVRELMSPASQSGRVSFTRSAFGRRTSGTDRS